MTLIRPAAHAHPARWFLRSDVDWWDLVRYGPPGYDAYARIAFSKDSEPDGYAAADEQIDAMRTALGVLAAYTTTPGSGYAAIWEGWGGREPAPDAPRVQIPHRTMLLFTGPVDALRDAPALAWYGSSTGVTAEPHLVWPEDRAWCLACEVDEELEFTVGCSIDAFRALSLGLPGAVRRAQYGDPVPMYRHPV